ncbi:GSCOCG00001437001-RA-CDS [Cotesia congregata]|nr:GSCOCG00001437001-RA-CDS [Cotesia congregata]
MKHFLRAFFIYTMVLCIHSKNFTKEITFENCQKNEWWIKNISPSLPIDNKINFEAEIGIGENTGNSSHVVKYSLTNCTDVWCKAFENLTIEGVDCATNGTEPEKEPCAISKILVNWTQNGTNLHTMSVKKLKNGCVKNVQTVGGEKKKPLAPGSVLQPFIKSIPMNPALTK